MISRRELLGISLGASAALALPPPLDAARGGPELVEGPELLCALHQVAQSPVWAHPASTGRSIIVKDIDRGICWSF